VFISDLGIMRFFIENEKGRALCQPCGGLVATTFKRRDVPFSDAKGFAQSYWWVSAINVIRSL